MLKRMFCVPCLLVAIVLAGCAAAVVAVPSAAPAQIPAGALMKYQVSGTTHYAFNSSVMLAPPTTGDASVAIQTAIDAMACANLSKGGVIFLAYGTYYLGHTLKIHGSGVTLVGARQVTSTGQDGAYPTLTYDASLVDSDYDTHTSTNCGTVYNFSSPTGSELSRPAAIRFNGNYDYSGSASFSYGGLIGMNITYTGSASATTDGGLATGISVNLPHQALFRDITITNSYDGVTVGSSTSPYFRNLTITNFRGPLGTKLGEYGSAAFKMFDLAITAASSNTTATLVLMPYNSTLLGAELWGGAVGISITGPTSASNADDIYIRSVLIEHPAKQGILLQYAQGVFISDTTINYAGAEAVKVLPGFYGGLDITNLRTTYSGFSAVRAQQGMNINLVNAELFNSGQNKSSATSVDLPIADLSIDSSVTALNVVGGRFGSVNGTTVNEDYGLYVSTATPAYTPWHTPTLIASNIDFLNLPTANRFSGITVSNIAGYPALANAGYFLPPAEDNWSDQGLPTDPVGSGVFAVVKGFNTYDLPEINNVPWVDITSSALNSFPVVDSSGNISPPNFTYWEGIAATQFPSGFVFYLPAGHFNSGFTTWTRKIYNLPSALTINKPNMQFLGDGRNITLLTNTNPDNEASNSMVLSSGSSNSGIFGFSLLDSLAIAEPSSPPSATTYAPPILVSNTTQVRVADIGVKYGIGGGISIVDTTDSELFDVDMTMGVNNSQPTVPNGVYLVTATSNESTHDIRFFQVNGEFLQNIYDAGYVAANGTHYCDTSTACRLGQSLIPELSWIRLVGGVKNFRVDHSTYIEGKTGWQTVSNGSGTPHELSSFAFGTDHIYAYGADFQQATDVDLVQPWVVALVSQFFVESGTTGAVRISTSVMRGAAFEGARIEGGTTVALVNDEIGNNGVLWTPYPSEQTRPLAGVFLGPAVGSTVFVGGMDGWIANSNFSSASTNANTQNYGIMLGTGAFTTSYTVYGTDLYGNWGGSTVTGTGCTVGSSCVSGRVGQQIAGGTSANVLVLNP